MTNALAAGPRAGVGAVTVFRYVRRDDHARRILRAATFGWWCDPDDRATRWPRSDPRTVHVTDERNACGWDRRHAADDFPWPTATLCIPGLIGADATADTRAATEDRFPGNSDASPLVCSIRPAAPPPETASIRRPPSKP